MQQRNSKRAATSVVKLYSGKRAKMLKQLDKLIEVMYDTAEVVGETDSFEVIDSLDTAYHEICLAFQYIKDTGETVH